VQGGAKRTPARPTRVPVPFRVLFVCLGNICRSPTAEGVMRGLLAQAGLADAIDVESAGTGSWHVGSRPDARAAAVASARGMPLDGRARQVGPEDFRRFDLLVAMDGENRRELLRLAHGEQEREKVRLLREFDPASVASGDLDVPDPYYGAAGGFEEVFELVRTACEGLIEQVRAPRGGAHPDGRRQAGEAP
jgi:low molecular weight protein-tyrosine phosphatase